MPGIRQVKRAGLSPAENKAWRDPAFRREYRVTYLAGAAWGAVLTVIVFVPLYLIAGGTEGELPNWVIAPAVAVILGGVIAFGPIFRRLRPRPKPGPTERRW